VIKPWRNRTLRLIGNPTATVSATMFKRGSESEELPWDTDTDIIDTDIEIEIEMQMHMHRPVQTQTH